MSTDLLELLLGDLRLYEWTNAHLWTGSSLKRLLDPAYRCRHPGLGCGRSREDGHSVGCLIARRIRWIEAHLGDDNPAVIEARKFR